MAYFGDGVIKSLGGFMNMIFLRTQPVAAGQPVDRVKNSCETVGFNRVQRINGAGRIKSAPCPILRRDKNLIKGKAAGEEQAEFIFSIDIQGIIRPCICRLNQVPESVYPGGILRVSVKNEGC